MKRLGAFLALTVCLWLVTGGFGADLEGVKAIIELTEKEGIKIWTDKGCYETGEYMTIYFKAEHSGYLTVYDFMPDGSTAILFPNAYYQNNYIKGGVEYQLPAPGDPFKFKVVPPSGFGQGDREILWAVITEEEIGLPDPKGYSQKSLAYSIKATLEDLPEDIWWASDMHEFAYGPCEEEEARKEWTFMVYLNADDSFLSQVASDDFNEIEEGVCKVETYMDVIVLWDGLGTHHPTGKRYHVQCDQTSSLAHYTEGETVWSVGEVDMGSPKTLKEFVNWATSEFPAKHYALVIWDHGSGWKKAPAFVRGVSFDQTNNSGLTMKELRSALSEVPHLDIVGFDACLMQMIEVGYEIKDYADFLVGSEEIEGGDGWDYVRILSALKGMRTPDPGNFIKAMISGNAGTPAIKTISALKLTGFRRLAERVSKLAEKLISNYDEDAILSARKKVQKFYYDSYVDLRHFAELIRDNVHSSSVQAAARDVISAFDSALVSNWNKGGRWKDAKGLSIFLPDPDQVPSWYSGYTNANLQFVQDTKWKEFLEKFIGH
ncbi:TPA: DUF4384 domain-containing protein [Candidatus Poribacteria bacterium]|nr:DUF4384 domain-containing protein [Candidatus Poribacteria bacterium]